MKCNVWSVLPLFYLVGTVALVCIIPFKATLLTAAGIAWLTLLKYLFRKADECC